MTEKQRNTLSRKEFLKLGPGAVIGAGLAGRAPGFIQRVHAAPNLEYRTIGDSDITVTAVGLGASRISEPSLIRRVLDMGVTFIDTGRMYARGRNEELIGKVLGNMRKNVVIQSKIDQKIQKNAVAMEKSIDDSLKALRTDYIDIMLVRGATTEQAVQNEIVHDVFRKAREAGKIRLCGFSAHSSNAPEMLRTGVDTGVYDVIMIPYNHSGSFTHSIYGIYSEWDQDALNRSIDYAVSKKKAVIAMKTCSGGPLALEGEARGTYGAALKWILRNKNVSTVVPAIASFREAEEDVAAMG